MSAPSSVAFPTLQSPNLTGPKPRKIVIADFNNDNFLDIAVLNDFDAANNASVDILLNNPAAPGTYGAAKKVGLPGNTAAMSIAVADIDGDMILDLLVSLRDNSQQQPPVDLVAIYSGDGNGLFVELAMLTGPEVVNPNGIVAADFNGDGVADIVVTIGTGGTGVGVNVVPMNDGGGGGGYAEVSLFVTTQGQIDPETGRPSISFNNPSKISVNGNAGYLYTANMNDDTLPDLITDNGIYINTGINTNNGKVGFSRFSSLAGNRNVAIGSLDTDDLLDIAQLNVKQGKVSDIIVQTMPANEPPTQQTLTITGANFTDIIISDLNLDGLGDIIAFDNNDKSLKIFLQFCNGTFPTTPINLNNTSASSTLASALLDNDAYPDIVALIDSKAGNNAMTSVWLQEQPALQAGTLQVCADQISSSESIGIAEVEVNRVNGSQGAVTVLYTSTGFGILAPATIVEDFNDVSATVGSVTFLDGEIGPKRMQFEIVDDTLVELEETFVVTLKSVDNPLVSLNDLFVDSYINISDNETNQPPMADAGAPQSVAAGQAVTLDGSASNDPDGTINSYLWTQITPTANPVILTGASSAIATFTAPNVTLATILSFQLVVTDIRGATSTATVQVTAGPAAKNKPPVAVPGIDQIVDALTLVSLDGSGSSDAEGSISSYQWVQIIPLDVTVSLTAADTAMASFIAPTVSSAQTPLILNFNLTVIDAGGISNTASIQIKVNGVTNLAPMADAGLAQSVVEGATVSLDGSGSSDTDGSIVAYAWKQIAGPIVVLSDASVPTPTFVAPVVTIVSVLSFELTVTDDAAAVALATVDITISPAPVVNADPIADAGPASTVMSAAIVELNGQASSDPENLSLTYLWQQVSGTPVDIKNSSAVIASFTAPTVVADTAFEFSLTVTDSANNVDVANVKITVLHQSGIANANFEKIVASGASVSVEAANATGPNGEGLTFAWQQLSGTDVVLTNLNTAKLTFFAPVLEVAEELSFKLSTTDAGGNVKTDIVNVLVLGQTEQTFVMRTAVIDVNANAGSVLLSVVRIGDMTSAISIPYSSKDVSAFAGIDYTASSGTLEFMQNEMTKTIEIPIINVESKEDLDRIFRMEVSLPASVIMNTQMTSKIVIHAHTKNANPGNLTQSGSAAEKSKLGAFDPVILALFFFLILVRQKRRVAMLRY
ncbi:MAG: PKD domain-containing protein [Thiohalomonadales bacterium]